MRIRKKPNLIPRMERCSHVLINTATDNRGNWLKGFPGYNELWAELGCGKGAFTAGTAEQSPESLLVAIEKVPDAMVMAMELACEKQLQNVKFIEGDAMELPEIFADGELRRIFLNFCDPWPRSHDSKKRLTSPFFLRFYASALSDGGEIHFKTDNDPLFEWSLEQFKAEGWDVCELTRNLHENGPVGIMTDYEKKFYQNGISINRLVAKKTSQTKSRSDGEPPRQYNAGIARPYRTSEVLKG